MRKMDKVNATASDVVTVSVTVSNTGKVKSQEVYSVGERCVGKC